MGEASRAKRENRSKAQDEKERFDEQKSKINKRKAQLKQFDEQAKAKKIAAYKERCAKRAETLNKLKKNLTEKIAQVKASNAKLVMTSKDEKADAKDLRSEIDALATFNAKAKVRHGQEQQKLAKKELTKSMKMWDRDLKKVEKKVEKKTQVSGGLSATITAPN